MTKKLAKSPWLLHYDGSSCNGCDIEVLACTSPKYDIERFGIINTGDPFQADILLITGGVNHPRTATTSRAAWTPSSRWTSMCPGAPPGPRPSSTVSSRRWRSCSASGKITPPGAAAARRKKEDNANGSVQYH